MYSNLVYNTVSPYQRSDKILTLDEKSHCLTKSRYQVHFQCTADVLNGPLLRTASQTDALTILGPHRGRLMTSRSPQIWCTLPENSVSDAICALDCLCIYENFTVSVNHRFWLHVAKRDRWYCIMLIVNFLHVHEFEDFRFFSDWNNQKSGGLHNIARLFGWSGECRNRVPIYWDSIIPGKG